MKKDIETKKDIELLVNTFYSKVEKDPFISHFFKTTVKVDWSKHLPIMYKFWENVVFYTGGYEGNPMQQHRALHTKSTMTMEHFQQWTFLFNETVDELFKGVRAELIKQRALSISTIMQLNIFS